MSTSHPVSTSYPMSISNPMSTLHPCQFRKNEKFELSIFSIVAIKPKNHLGFNPHQANRGQI